MISGLQAQSWEEAVNWVTVPGDHRRLQLSARAWSQAFGLIQQIDRNLVMLIEKVRSSFAGPGANALIERLTKVHESLTKTCFHHDQMPRALNDCAVYLSEAARTIPLPDWIVRDVLAKQAEYERTGRFTPFGPDEFWQKMPRGRAIEYYLYRHAYSIIYGYAETIQANLANQYVAVARSIMPQGTAVPVPGGDRRTITPGGGRNGLTDTRMPTMPVSPATLPPGGNNTGGLNTNGLPTANLDPPVLDPSGPDVPGLDSSGLGLGGLSDEELTRLRGGGGEIGAGLAGMGEFGRADGLGRLGPLISPEAMAGTQPGTGPVGARLAGGGVGALGVPGLGGLGMIPAGLGAGAPPGAADEDRSTMLIEDDKTIFAPRGQPGKVDTDDKEPADLPTFLID